MAYSKWFYLTRRGWARSAASRILPMVLERTSARSLLDVGCGTGAWLAVAREIGLSDCRGVDGPWVRTEDLEIPRETFRAVDLTGEWNTEPVDLAMSLEVGEHLAGEVADRFVERLCAAAPVVLFSAAIPGQGGQDHVNEQWPSYWIEKFAARGYELFDVLRPRVWDDQGIPYWYRQNILLFVGPGADPQRVAALAAERDALSFEGKALVHPEHALRALQYPGIAALARALPFALVRSLSGMLPLFRPAVAAGLTVMLLAACLGVRALHESARDVTVEAEIVRAFEQARSEADSALVFLRNEGPHDTAPFASHAEPIHSADAEGIVSRFLDDREDFFVVEKRDAEDLERLDSRGRLTLVAEAGAYALYRESRVADRNG